MHMWPPRKSLSTLTTFLYVITVICFTFLSLALYLVWGKWKRRKKTDKQKVTNTRLTTFFMTLIDIDECVSGVHDCHSSASCKNTVGSFSCSCNHPYTGDGKTCRLAAGKYMSLSFCSMLGKPYLYNRVKRNTIYFMSLSKWNLSNLISITNIS